jgi:hypothetical protein
MAFENTEKESIVLLISKLIRVIGMMGIRIERENIVMLIDRLIKDVKEHKNHINGKYHDSKKSVITTPPSPPHPSP